MRSDVVIGGGLLAFAAFYAYLTLQLDRPSLPHTLGPAFLPKLLTGLLVVMVILLMLQTRSRHPEEATPLPPGATARMSGLVALMVAYTAAMASLGYFLTTPLFLAGSIWLAGEHRPLRVLGWALCLFVGVHLLLRVLFSVPLPLGPLD